MTVQYKTNFTNTRTTPKTTYSTHLLQGILLHRFFLFALQSHSDDVTFVALFLFILCHYTIWKRQQKKELHEGCRILYVSFIEHFHILLFNNVRILALKINFPVENMKLLLLSITYNVSYAETQLADGRVNGEINIFV